MSEVCNNVVCPGCGCLCDDITLTFDKAKLIDFQPPCDLGKRWFQSQTRRVSSAAEVCGVPTELHHAMDRAAELLHRGDYPLVYGLSRSSTPGQRAAVALGEFLGGAVDTTASLCHGPSIMALQEFGEVTCTLGEIRNRADLVIFWGCNPAQSHPRHAERYSVNPKGRFVPNGRSDRKVVMIGNKDQIGDWHLDHEGTLPDLKIAVEPSKDFEMLRMLTAMLQDHAMPDVPEELKRLMAMMHQCKYGVFFFGLGLAETGSWGGTERTGTGHINVSALLHLIAELNAVTRFTARRMRLQGDVSARTTYCAGKRLILSRSTSHEVIRDTTQENSPRTNCSNAETSMSHYWSARKLFPTCRQKLASTSGRFQKSCLITQVPPD